MIEEINDCCLKNVPRLTTNENMKVCAHLKRKIIFELDIGEFLANETVLVEKLLSQIEKLLGKNSICKLKWQLNDKIFKLVPLSDFKQACFETLKKISISLIRPVEIVENNNEKLNILQQLHDNKLFGGRCGPKLIEKLKSQFYWPELAKDAHDFVKNCKKCLLNKVRSSTIEPMTLTPIPKRPLKR